MRHDFWAYTLLASAALASGCTRTTASADASPAAAAAAPAASGRRPIVLGKDTPIKVRTTTTVSTRNNRAGDAFGAVLEEPLMADGIVLANRGAQVEGLVADANPGGRVKGRAHLELRLAKIHTNRGVIDVLTNERGQVAHGTKKRDGLMIGIGSGVGAAVGALAGGGKGAAIGAGAGGAAGTGLVLGTRGAPSVIGAETVLTFRLREPITIF